jgi:hypothetical protein
VSDSRVLLDASGYLLTRDDWALSHWWARGAALLARQAIEAMLEEYWQMQSPPMAQASLRAQFLALHVYVPDADLIRAGHVTWSLLSRACHYHPYDLAPTADEVQGWVTAADAFCAGLRDSARFET